MFRALLVALCILATSTVTSSVAEEDEFSVHLVGCWQHGEIPPFTGKAEEVYMTKTCFDGGVRGNAVHVTCHGFGTFDCWESAESYALTGSKLHFTSSGAEILCDAQVVPGETLRLYNCNGTKAPFAERIYVRVGKP
jgi:hypothetical protein